MPTRGFLPNTDTGLLQWASAFSTQITANPTSFGLVASQAVSFATLFTTYQSALNAATNESTRTKGTIAAKDNAARTLRISAANLAKIIEGTPSVTDQQKLNLGLNVRAMPSPKAAPDTAPVIKIVSISGRTIKAQLLNVDGVKRSRPDGTNGATILSHVGPTPPTNIGAWKFEGSTGKTSTTISFDSALPPGTTIWLTAFWVGSRMESGPACDPISVTFGAAGVSMAA